jgi:hypothetical protein
MESVTCGPHAHYHAERLLSTRSSLANRRVAIRRWRFIWLSGFLASPGLGANGASSPPATKQSLFVSNLQPPTSLTIQHHCDLLSPNPPSLIYLHRTLEASQIRGRSPTTAALEARPRAARGGARNARHEQQSAPAGHRFGSCQWRACSQHLCDAAPRRTEWATPPSSSPPADGPHAQGLPPAEVGCATYPVYDGDEPACRRYPRRRPR